ncbi:protein mono-ADP-ribosyltransferase PARP12-like isoform X2 [Emydura macquarii macquarii]|uniref:protein mono-ADP-ribosyltransferase PARP12-like isoform X2 n=1 Tax=Emydura macquarii macquarii TaxID=1129001 RepID=UPI00352B3BFD
MSDPAVCSFITKVLCAHGGRLERGRIPEHVGLPAPQLEQILADVGPRRFLGHGQGGSGWVLAVCALRLCVRKECAGCERLHLCKLNLMGRCNFGARACKYSHDILTEGNRKVLKAHELSGLNENELRVLLLQNDPFLLPDVCQFYSKGGGLHGTCTQQENCNKLHICRHFLRGECRFPKCKRSHNLLNIHALRLLLAAGLDTSVVENIQIICDHKHAEFSKEMGQAKMPPPHLRATPLGDKRKAGAGKQEEIGCKLTSTTAASTSHEVTVPAVKAVPPAAASGSSAIQKCDEICLYYVWRYCVHKDNCRMIHYHLPYRWQKFDGINWIDLPKMEVVEKAYCDPQNDSLADQNINFNSITSSSALVRRLSTPSSVTKPPKFIMTTKWMWYWKNDLGQWIEYGQQNGPHEASALTSDDLENLFLADPDDTVQFQAGSQQYEISFKEMVQKNVLYQTKRRVRRRPKFVSAEDVKKMKKGQTAAATPDQNYPKNWDKSAMPDMGYKAVEIFKTSSEYIAIESLFKKTMNNYVIQRMRRIQNPSLWQVFQWQKEQMKKKNDGKNVDERLLFHGTNSSLLEAICNQNFDWRICGVHGTSYGKGSYFARDAKYAHSYCQSLAKGKTMFVARVLVGDFVGGRPDYVRPPHRSANILTFYDSCVDKVVDPSIFVIFEKHQIYPEYIIEYSEEEKKCFVS